MRGVNMANNRRWILILISILIFLSCNELYALDCPDVKKWRNGSSAYLIVGSYETNQLALDARLGAKNNFYATWNNSGPYTLGSKNYPGINGGGWSCYEIYHINSTNADGLLFIFPSDGINGCDLSCEEGFECIDPLEERCPEGQVCAEPVTTMDLTGFIYALAGLLGGFIIWWFIAESL